MWITVIGLILILVGYAMEVMFYGFETPFFDCSIHENCREEAAVILSQLIGI